MLVYLSDRATSSLQQQQSIHADSCVLDLYSRLSESALYLSLYRVYDI